MRTIPTLATVAALAAATLALAPVAAAGGGHGPGPGKGPGPGHGPRGGCESVEALFCEDFESEPTGGAASLDWGVDTRHGTLKVERAGHAGKVLRVHTEDNGYAFLKVVDFAAPENTFYGRLRIKVDDFPTAPDWAHFTLVEVTGSGSDEVVRPLGGQFAPTVGPDATFWGVGADGGPTGDWTNWRESAPTVEDQWQCVEFEWFAPENRVSVWFDGVPQPDLTVTGDDHGGADVPFVLPTADTVKIGWQLYQGGATPDQFDVWVDDITLSAERVGCGR
ncbi:hypothetical protein [Cellulomonas xiejunii]|uniref:GH16 domain-containing protein n=1 Tax=Cellulomonas xiejunii TaxID=2968083 RepID=A0ABY5KSL7_9CELL|nr:hypothetical protein [Cellulomonas xiejunii]MCC2314925.1 hypothetical protein [Cellulomonas xiejunii]MCC2322114.1 hypothetical protein [Cellulomonas xiejunii]MCC2323243.1 hypothetical protein [Cellulomonas xiejunii]UUI72171.1 hypothetical protein NP048_01505 [Cellulomonas xiejunii]